MRLLWRSTCSIAKVSITLVPFRFYDQIMLILSFIIDFVTGVHPVKCEIHGLRRVNCIQHPTDNILKFPSWNGRLRYMRYIIAAILHMLHDLRTITACSSVMINEYPVRTTVNAVNFADNFSRLAAQKHIRGLLNSRLADAHLIFLYCTNTWHHTIHLQATGQHKNKAGLTHSPVYYPFASTLMCIQNIANIFAGFWIHTCWILCEIREN